MEIPQTLNDARHSLEVNLKATWSWRCHWTDNNCQWSLGRGSIADFPQQSINQFIIALIQPLVSLSGHSLPKTSINLLSSSPYTRFSFQFYIQRHTSHRSQTCHQSTCWWERKVDKLRDSSPSALDLHLQSKNKVTFLPSDWTRMNTGMTQFITLNWWMFMALECSIQPPPKKHLEFRWRLKRIFTPCWTFFQAFAFIRSEGVLMVRSSTYLSDHQTNHMFDGQVECQLGKWKF